MNTTTENNLINILRAELVPALGCTEPIALAYAAAKARDVLGEFPTHLQIRCSGNIIKNVKAVTVPNSGGLKGVEVAGVLGLVGGNAERELEVLQEVTPEDIEKTKQLIQEGFFDCKLQENVANLYIVATATSKEHMAEVTIINRHTLITKIVKDGETIFKACGTDEDEKKSEDSKLDRSKLSVEEILNFADEVDIDKLESILQRQVELNSAIADAGIKEGYGAQIGKTLLEVYGNDVKTRAKARAAAGSDARMSGCSLPVVINSGSGNQGMTVCLPVVEFAKENKATDEELYRALIVSNLVSVHQKYYIGELSAFCGAVTAACGAGAGITYISGGSHEQVSATIINTLANVGGIMCDGAKPSCAAKIATAVDAAIMGHYLSMKGLGFKPGEGIIQKDIERTIKSLGYVGRVGMKSTDQEILKIMMNRLRDDELSYEEDSAV